MKTLKKILTLSTGLLIAGSAMAADYYLQDTMANGVSPLDNTIWFTSPVVGEGVDKATDGGSFGGNSFYTNGFGFRTQSTTGTGSFSGEFVVAIAAPVMELQAGTWNANAGMDINNSILMRIRRDTVNLNVSDMNLGPSADLSFRSNGETTQKNLNLSLGTLSGSGLISFGQFSTDVDATWGVSVTDASSFTGVMDLQYGDLTFATELAMGGSGLTISSNTNSVALSNNATFGSLSYDGVDLLLSGDYDAATLNGLTRADLFSGAGTFTVVPEPSTFAIIGGMLALSAVMLRRRQ